jgi:hypothetical protein
MFGAQKLYSVKIPMVLLSQAYWLLTIVAVVLSYLNFLKPMLNLLKGSVKSVLIYDAFLSAAWLNIFVMGLSK